MTGETAPPTDAQPENAPSDQQVGDTSTNADGDKGVDWQQEADKWKALSRRHEQRARENAEAAQELATVRQSQMTEQERAVHTARDEARAEALAEFGSRLVDAKFEAAAAGRTVNGRPLDVGALLEGVNRSYYLTSDGEVDADKVTRFVNNVAPVVDVDTAATRRVPDLGQGRRTTSRGSTADQFAGALEGLLR